MEDEIVKTLRQALAALNLLPASPLGFSQSQAKMRASAKRRIRRLLTQIESNGVIAK